MPIRTACLPRMTGEGLMRDCSRPINLWLADLSSDMAVPRTFSPRD